MFIGFGHWSGRLAYNATFWQRAQGLYGVAIAVDRACFAPCRDQQQLAQTDEKDKSCHDDDDDEHVLNSFGTDGYVAKHARLGRRFGE
jgi:hypothetical protein